MRASNAAHSIAGDERRNRPDWISRAMIWLSAERHWGYRAGSAAATEPLALAALALAAHGRRRAASSACRWLVDVQTSDGSLGVLSGQPRPCWPTGWAVLAWRAMQDTLRAEGGYADAQTAENAIDFTGPIERARDWLLASHGEPVTDPNHFMGHDTQLVAWSWVAGTHSWVEPTAINLLALKAVGYGDHPRARQAVELLIDRSLPNGGCNYGNTYVLGQQLLPHIQPSGLALLALCGEDDATGRIALTRDYLADALDAMTPVASLGCALMGLAAHGIMLPHGDQWLADAVERTHRRGAVTPRIALAALAARGADGPLVRMAQQATVERLAAVKQS